MEYISTDEDIYRNYNYSKWMSTEGDLVSLEFLTSQNHVQGDYGASWNETLLDNWECLEPMQDGDIIPNDSKVYRNSRHFGGVISVLPHTLFHQITAEDVRLDTYRIISTPGTPEALIARMWNVFYPHQNPQASSVIEHECIAYSPYHQSFSYFPTGVPDDGIAEVLLEEGYEFRTANPDPMSAWINEEFVEIDYDGYRVTARNSSDCFAVLSRTTEVVYLEYDDVAARNPVPVLKIEEKENA